MEIEIAREHDAGAGRASRHGEDIREEALVPGKRRWFIHGSGHLSSFFSGCGDGKEPLPERCVFQGYSTGYSNDTPEPLSNLGRIFRGIGEARKGAWRSEEEA
jgi:hypothetical protein